ncbi:sucrose-phosphate phosphatase [Ancylothrix sp. C2]|uniref:sucrose-phosphate phosphatase n=1 Tax=Ancylothrix sp. D3o TaxID=2953691 RepID=UPI0021BA43BB|nr:sucrose-phosphate phosphatase [Ancylothrix sp. D3o]MCT7951097.1 sucrose-phosphate phosphatase [Ancylothrix sp. D3o]
MSSSFLLVTDLDNTLVGDDQALAHLNRHLQNHRTTYGTKIVYSTGRSLTSYQQLRQETQLLDPDALITSVGCEIYHQNSPNPDPAWSEILTPGWNRQLVINTAAEFSQLIPQPEPEQRPYKISYFLTQKDAENIIPKLQNNLQKQNLKIKLIYSSNKDLDIIPQQADKGQAMQYLRKKWQIPSTQTVVCGDSGNDIAMFSAGTQKGIIVGNAQPELLNWHKSNPSPNHYLAKATCAGGILEGLKNFHLLPT